MNHIITSPPGAVKQPFPFEDLEGLLERDLTPSHQVLAELQHGKYSITDWITVTRDLKVGSPLYQRANRLRVALSVKADQMRKALDEPTDAEILAGRWDADRWPDASESAKRALWEAV